MAIAGQLLIEIGANVASLQRDIAKANSALTSFARDTERIFKALGVAAAGAFTLKVAEGFIKAAAEAETRTIRLEAVLRSHGVATKEVTDAYAAYADQLAATTIYSRGELQNAEQILTTMGVMPTKMRDAMQATVSLASRTGDLASASQMIGMAFEGNMRGIRKYIPMLGDVKKGSMDAAAVMKVIQGTFGDLAQKETEGYAGKVAQLENQWKIFSATMGQVFIPVMKDTVEWINQMYSSYLNFLGIATQGTKKAELQMIEQLFKSGEYKQYTDEGTLTGKYMRMLELKKELEKPPPTVTDKGYISPNVDAFKKQTPYQLAIIKLNKEIEDSKAKAMLEGAAKTAALTEKEWKTFEKDGVSRAKFNELMGARELLRQSELAKDARKLNLDNNVKMFEDSQKALDTLTDYNAEKAQKLEQIWAEYDQNRLAHSQNVMSDLTNQLSGIGGLGALSDLMKTQKDQNDQTDIYSQREIKAQEHLDKMKLMYLFHENETTAIAEAQAEYDMAAEENKYRYKQKLGIGYLSTVAETFDNLYKLTGSKSLALFRLTQAAAVATTIVSTYVSAQETYRAVQGSIDGAWGVAAGAAAAAAVTVAGFARVASIMSQQPGGGASSGSSPGVSVGGTSAASPSTAYGQTASRSQTINVNVYGTLVSNKDELARELVPALARAMDEGAR
jgi:hypothetical protein